MRHELTERYTTCFLRHAVSTVPAVQLDDIVITGQLAQRPRPPHDFVAENAAFIELTRVMATDPDRLPQRLVDLALDLCSAGTAGVSLLEPGGAGNGVFRWVALSGAYKGFVGGTTPEEFSPCGVSLARNAPQLYSRPGRYFTYLDDASPPIVEGLVIPFRSADGPVGTIWIVSHTDVSFTPRDVAVMRNLADFTAAALALQQARRRAEDGNRLKGELLAMVSHELLTPVGAILGWSELLLSGKAPVETLAAALDAIRDNASRQSRMVDDLLDAARIGAVTLRVERSPVDLAAVVRGAIAAVEAAAERSSVHVTSDVADDLLLFEGDGQRLQQIVTNLLTNAVKFTGTGGAVHLALGQMTDGVAIRVSDTGLGMSEAQLAVIFEPFRQAHASLTQRHEGLGLGLSIARRLAELHGGTLTAESEGPGYGSTFMVRLPAERLLLRAAIGCGPMATPADVTSNSIAL